MLEMTRRPNRVRPSDFPNSVAWAIKLVDAQLNSLGIDRADQLEQMRTRHNRESKMQSVFYDTIVGVWCRLNEQTRNESIKGDIRHRLREHYIK